VGEYAEYQGERIKIGTCEDMYYLRADQAHLVRALPGNVDPVRDRDGIRFRFPFPDEDGIAPGEFEQYERGVTLWRVKPPEGVEHYSVQFKASNGYLISLPCPEMGSEGLVSLTADGSDHPYRVARNGYGGATELVQQRYWKGLLVAVCHCMGCGAAYRLPTIEDAQPVIDELHAMASRETMTAERNGTPGNELIAVRLRTIADRVLAGYALPRLALANELAEF
jgi:hypothetical protein